MKASTFRVAQVAFMIIVVVLFRILIAMLAKSPQQIVILKDESQPQDEAKDKEAKEQDILVVENDKPVSPIGFLYKKALSNLDDGES